MGKLFVPAAWSQLDAVRSGVAGSSGPLHFHRRAVTLDKENTVYFLRVYRDDKKFHLVYKPPFIELLLQVCAVNDAAAARRLFK